MHYSLFVIGNNGGLVFLRHFSPKVDLSDHDCLKLASSLYTIGDLTELAAHVRSEARGQTREGGGT